MSRQNPLKLIFQNSSRHGARQAPSTNIQPITCQAAGNCRPRSPTRPWSHKQVLPWCVFLTPSALPPTCAARSQLPQRELTGCSHPSVQFHSKVSASQQTWLAVNKTRQGKMEDWLGATKKDRILLELVSVDEASSSSETKASCCLVFLQ